MDAGVRVLSETVRLALAEEAAPQLVGHAEREGVPRAGARRHAQAKPRAPVPRGLQLGLAQLLAGHAGVEDLLERHAGRVDEHGAIDRELLVGELDAGDDALDGDDLGPDEEHARWRGRGDVLGPLGWHGERAQECPELEDVHIARLLGGEVAVQVELDARELPVRGALELEDLVREPRHGEAVPVHLQLLGELRRVEEALHRLAARDVHEDAARWSGDGSVERHV